MLPLKDMITDEMLADMAKDAMKNSYSPYSEFSVGAAIITDDGSVFTGCNIENAAYGVTICAERCAVSEAVKNGYRHIVKIAICGGKNGEISDFCPPCGECRQVISEFADEKTQIILSNGVIIKKYTINQILPERFMLSESDK